MSKPKYKIGQQIVREVVLHRIVSITEINGNYLYGLSKFFGVPIPENRIDVMDVCCPVCSVIKSVENNKIRKHNNLEGELCYGSYIPVESLLIVRE